MRKMQLGPSGQSVSGMCLGTMYFGSKLGAAKAQEIADAFVAAGGDFIDTANIYAGWIDGCRGGESEAFLGEWMHQRKNRVDLFVATKMGFEYDDVPRSASAHLIEQECDRSLRRLKTDYIDLFYIHCDDPETPLDEILEALSRLLRSGKIRTIGASNFRTDRLRDALDTAVERDLPPFCCIQQRHSYLTPAPGVDTAPQVVADKGLRALCKARSLGFLAYSPLIGGTYSGFDEPLPPDYASNANIKRLDVLKSVCAETSATGNQVVLAWLMQNRTPAIPLLGVSSTRQLTENLGALEIELSSEQLRRLDEAHELAMA